MLTNGPIPDGLFVCHSCDNRPCCNPAHLWLGTTDDNMADMVAKGRSASGDRSWSHQHPETQRGEQNGHSILTEDQVRAIRADTRSQAAIGADYGIAQAHVSRIKLRQNWKHVA
jgi:hypothetical protein